MAQRSSRRFTVVAIVVVVLLGLLVAADRIGVAVAEHITATQIQDSQHLSSTPSVDIAGFPFLSQLASSDYDEVTVDAQGVPLGSKAHGARLQRLHAVLHDVQTSRNFHQIHAGSLTATGTTSYAELSKAIDQGRLTYAGDGRVALRKSLSYHGIHVSGTVSSRPFVDDNGDLAFDDTQIDSAGSLIATVSKALTSLFTVHVPIDDVPFSLQARRVTVTPAGVSFTLSGTDVDLTARAA